MTLILAPHSGAIPATYHAIGSSSPIPFRKTSVVSGPEVVGTLVTTLLVLAAVAVLAWFARRQGWLERWTGSAATAPTTMRSLTVLEIRRISRKTTLYRVRNGTSEFLLAESSAQVQLLPVQADAERPS
jgi:hypothetical protein